MKNDHKHERDMRDEYDFSRAVIGKYAARYAKGTNVVLLDSDIVRLFPDSKSVNDALRSLVRIADRRTKARMPDAPSAASGRSRRD
jgi:hypothetical protein